MNLKQLIQNCSFVEALAHVQKAGGRRALRADWVAENEPVDPVLGDFIFLVPGSTFQVSRPPLNEIYDEGTEVTYHAHVDIRKGGIIMPYTPSQEDMAARDWIIVVME